MIILALFKVISSGHLTILRSHKNLVTFSKKIKFDYEPLFILKFDNEHDLKKFFLQHSDIFKNNTVSIISEDESIHDYCFTDLTYIRRLLINEKIFITDFYKFLRKEGSVQSAMQYKRHCLELNKNYF